MDTSAEGEGRAGVRRAPTAIGAAALLGILAGVGGFTFAYGDGAAYLSDDPRACTNCHIMRELFDTWLASSHHHVAVCNDCHLPPDFPGRWIAKADNGFRHSLAFTTGDFPEPIRISPRNAGRVERACLSCHAQLVHPQLAAAGRLNPPSCTDCHAGAGHFRR